MSSLFLRTLRDDPADAEVPSHKLLVRAGYVRRVASGIWTWLPLGKIVLDRVGAVVREEMDRIGGQEVLFPALLPREPYETSGRWSEYGDLLFRLKDRRGNDYLLGPTHEELFTLLVKGEYSSYKDLPVILYQVQTKYRDEARPRSGILRGREFVMKDAYSFDLDDAGLQKSYDLHREAYVRIFDRLGLDYRIVSAVSGRDGRQRQRGVPRARPRSARTPSSPARTAATRPTSRRCPRSPPEVDASGRSTPPMEEIPTPDTPTIETLAAAARRAGVGDAEERPGQGGRRAGRGRRARATARSTWSGSRPRSAPAVITPFEAADFAAHPELVRGYVGPQGRARRPTTPTAGSRRARPGSPGRTSRTPTCGTRSRGGTSPSSATSTSPTSSRATPARAAARRWRWTARSRSATSSSSAASTPTRSPSTCSARTASRSA